MVPRPHVDLGLAENGVETAVRVDGDAVVDAGRSEVDDLVSHLGGDVLDERPALHDVRELRAQADAEHGLVGREPALEQLALEVPALPRHGNDRGRGLFAIDLGRDVPPAHQHEPIEALEIGGQRLLVAQRRQHHRNRASRLHRLDVGHEDPSARGLAALPSQVDAGDADQWGPQSGLRAGAGDDEDGHRNNCTHRSKALFASRAHAPLSGAGRVVGSELDFAHGFHPKARRPGPRPS